METKQTAESTKTDAQFKIDYNSGKYYEAVSNKLFEIGDTLSAMLGCSKDDILNPLQIIVVGVVRSKRAALEKQKQQSEEFHKKGVEKVKKHANIFKQLHDLLGDDFFRIITSEDLDKEWEEFCTKKREKIKNP